MTAREAIATTKIVFVSAASAWEAGIKIALGRLTLPEPFGHGVEQSGFRRLAISFEHAEAAAKLPGITAIRSIACSSHKPSWKAARS